MKNLWLIAGLLIAVSCSQNTRSKEQVNEKIVDFERPMELTLEQAEEVVSLPITCIDVEYPNKLNQVIGGDIDLKSPESLHPAFYGCFDWHSAVHGHWSLVRIARFYPDIVEYDQIIEGLQRHITPENIRGELAYFDHELSQGFERMYGWAWLLKLAEELHRWETPEAKQLEKNLQPLTDLIVSKVVEFLPKLHYPIRVGTHTNTAFALAMIYDYAEVTENTSLLELVKVRSREYYLNDKNCPLTWEPSGYDFLSPCLEEADLMRRVLPKKEFKVWLSEFLPNLVKSDFTLEPGIVSDRTDGHLVHLDGLNYSRAWCMFGIAETLPEFGYLNKIANEHIQHSLPDLTDGNYEGGHWLASFALMSLTR